MTGGGPTPTVEAILTWLDEKPGLSRCIAAARRLDQLRGDDPGALTPRTVVVLRNFTIEPLEPVWKVAGARAGLGLDIRYSGYDPGPGDELDGLMASQPDAVFVALRLDEFAPALSRDFLTPGRPPADALADGIVERVMSLVD
ncbi:MAG TPA: hypothetical protein VGI06_02895, partial [Acidimicrobiales bacterium]